MKNTILNLIISILSHRDINFISNKIEVIKDQLRLNAVELQIVKDIEESLQLNEIISIEFIKQKYSYAFINDENLIEVIIKPEAIDSAVSDILIGQAKQDLKKDLVTLGSTVDSLSPSQLKQKVSNLLENKLLEDKTGLAPNNLQTEENPYENLHHKSEGLSLVIPKIEEHSGKARKGTVVTILGFAGSFKSTYALNVAYKNALDGHNILYLALESTATDLITRLVLNHIASTTNDRDKLIDSMWIRDNKLTENYKKIYNEKHNEVVKLLNNRLIVWDEQDVKYDTFIDMTNTLRKADEMFKQTTGRGLDGFVLDQLALLKFTSASGKKYSYEGGILNDWVSYLRKQSLNFLDSNREIVVFMVSQINRESYLEASKPKKKGRYDITSASDSNEIERASETMITLYKDLDTQNTLLINIPKARSGFVPDNPIQVEVYGQYFHIGPLNVTGETITAEDFDKPEFSLQDLINASE